MSTNLLPFKHLVIHSPRILTVVHAGLVPGIPLDEQTLGNMYTMRNVFQKDRDGDGDSDSAASASGETKIFSGLSSENKGDAWIKSWDGKIKINFPNHNFNNEQQSYHVYFGHDAKRMLQLGDFATGLDTGCCYG